MHSSSVVVTAHFRAQTFSEKSGLNLWLPCLQKVLWNGHLLFVPFLLNLVQSVGRITEEQAKAHGHLKIVGLVGSIDNDMSMTDLTIGAPTALHRICEALDNIDSTAYSHSRAFVLEVMGRHCGWLALMAGIRYTRCQLKVTQRCLTSDVLAVVLTSFCFRNDHLRLTPGKTRCAR